MVTRASVLAVATVFAVGVAGCGKQDDGVVIDDPVAEALAFAPADAAALAVVATDTEGGPGATLAALGRRFPGIELVVAQGRALLGDRLGLDVEEDLEPLLQHPLVLWSADGSATARSAAWVVRDERRLGRLLEDRKRTGALRGAEGIGEFSVFTRPGGAAYARRGPVLVTAPNATALAAALQRREAATGRWDRALLRRRGLGLPEGAVARVLLDAGALVARRGEELRKVPWGAALDRAALTVTPVAGGLRVHARASTRPLPAIDVPIAQGVAPPVARGRAPLVAAVRDPQQTLAFARRVTDLLDPERLDGLRRAEEVLGRYARVSVQDDLLDRLTGTATLTSPDGRRLTLRAELDDPERTRDALGRIGALARFGGPLASLAGVDLGGLDVAERDGRYALTQDGRLLVALQVVDGALVASNDPSADLLAAGRAQAGAPAPTAGAFRGTVDAELLKDQLIARLGLPAFVRGALAPLGSAVVTALAQPDLLDVQLVLPVSR